ncbi:MAG: ABC transporter substrate-binding protein [Spirochaetaceae bacterium]
MIESSEKRRAFVHVRDGLPGPLLFFILLLLSTGAPANAETESIRYAASLTLSRQGDRTVVTISNAWDGAPPLRYLLLKRGSEEDLTEERREYDGVIEVPLRRIASLATPAIAHLADLESLDRIVAVDDADYVYNSRIRRRIREGDIPEVGSGSSLNVERLLLTEPELVILSALGPDDPTVRRLESVGISVLPLADWREQSPLGRAEWVKLFGELLEKEAEADSIFEPRASRYLELEAMVSSDSSGSDPKVLTNAPWQGSWPVPAGRSYVARLIDAAGGEYLWAEREGTGSVFLDFESVLARGAEADVWINLNQGWKRRADALETDPRLAAFAPFRNNRMYHHNRRLRPSGANDFWESGATRPDLVLADLIRILHPDLLPNHDMIYYNRLEP